MRCVNTRTFLIIGLMCSILSCELIDDRALEDEQGRPIGEYIFAGGPEGSSSYAYAQGLVNSASETLGIFMQNRATAGSLDNALRLVSGDTYHGDAYMALVQEDVYDYLQRECQEDYEADPDSVKTDYLRAVSSTEVIMSLYTETVHLLVSGSSGIGSLEDITGTHRVNIGPEDSGTYVTSRNILNAYGAACVEQNREPADGVQAVLDGACDAAFFVTEAGSEVFKSIPSGADVKLIKVSMPDGNKSYSETGTIFAGDYPFQENDISGNISVRTLLVAGPAFDDTNVDIFIDYLFEHAEEFGSINSKWDELTASLTVDYIIRNPEKMNFRALCRMTGYPELEPVNVDDNFFTDYEISSYHDMYTELDYLMTLNTGVGLKEVNTTGTWENAYRLMRGEGRMALVQDDVFNYLKSSSDMFDSIMIASMKKLVPLHYEYVHLLSAGGVLLPDLLAAGSRINVGPKTSGSFMTAMKIIRSYTTVNENMSYSFDSAADAALKVASGEYDAAFVVSGTPYDRFYSHDTWALSSLAGCEIVPALFEGDMPSPYRLGLLAGGALEGSYYPYRAEIQPADIQTVRVRAVQVASPAFENENLTAYLKSVFRKSYYMTYGPDTEDFTPDPLWISIKKDSVSAADADYDTYGEYVEGVKEYFVNNPFGWHKDAAEYYISMFAEAM